MAGTAMAILVFEGKISGIAGIQTYWCFECVKLLLLLLATITTSEWSLTVLRLVKTYPSSTMALERLKNLTLLHDHAAFYITFYAALI